MNLGEMRTALRAYLGIADTDKAFTATRLDRWLNDALNELRAETPAGYHQTRSTWTPDGGTGRVYTLSSQSPAVTALQKVVEARLGSTTGTRLREVPYEQLVAWGGSAYALTGRDESAVLTTADGVAEGLTLYVLYETWPDELDEDTDEATWLPRRFHDVPVLMAAEIAFVSGDEGRMPDALATKLLDRRAQLITHMRRRSTDVMLVRQVDNPIY